MAVQLRRQLGLRSQGAPQHDAILEMVHELAHPINALQLHLVGFNGLDDLLGGMGQGDVGIAVRDVLQPHLPPDRVDLHQLLFDLDQYARQHGQGLELRGRTAASEL